MNPHSGAIAAFENDEDAKKAGHTIPLTDQQAQELLQVRREERVKALESMLKEIEKNMKEPGDG